MLKNCPGSAGTVFFCAVFKRVIRANASGIWGTKKKPLFRSGWYIDWDESGLANHAFVAALVRNSKALASFSPA